MINPSKCGLGDFVVADSDIHDYAKTGDIFRLISSEIPNEATSAVGWMFDKKTGVIKEDQAYKLPHDKISLVHRTTLADILKPALGRAEAKKRAADREYKIVLDRIEGLVKHSSKEEEMRSLMARTFGHLDGGMYE